MRQEEKSSNRSTHTPVYVRLADLIDRFVCGLGRVVAWLCLAMVLMTVIVVVLRYFFDAGWIWMQESVTWMHGLVFMLAAAYTLSMDEHVRVDIFYSRQSRRRQAIIDTAGVVILLLPTCAWIAIGALDYVGTSWAVRETSPEAGGLPGLYLLKTVIIVTPILLALEGVAFAVRAWLRVAHERSSGPGTGVA